MTDGIDKRARDVRSAAEALQRTARSEKDVVIARIRARRPGLAPSAEAEAAADEVQAALGELERRSRHEAAGAASAAGAPAASELEPSIPVEARLIARDPLAAQPVAARDRFPRSTTLRLALRHPALFALGAGLVLRLGPARLLLVARLALPFLRK